MWERMWGGELTFEELTMRDFAATWGLDCAVEVQLFAEVAQYTGGYRRDDVPSMQRDYATYSYYDAPNRRLRPDGMKLAGDLRSAKGAVHSALRCMLLHPSDADHLGLTHYTAR